MKILIVIVLSSIICFTFAKNINERNSRDELLKRTAELEAKATAVIKKLQIINQAGIAAVEKEWKNIQKLVAELKSATGEEAIKLLGNELSQAEVKLDTKIRDLDIADETKIHVLSDAVKLEGNMEVEIKKLEAEGRVIEANRLLRYVTELQSLSAHLLQAHGTLGIRFISIVGEIKALEDLVTVELRRLNTLGFSTANPAATTLGSIATTAARPLTTRRHLTIGKPM